VIARHVPIVGKAVVALVSSQDAENVLACRWYYYGKYVFRHRERGGKKLQSLQKFILSPLRGQYIDHINGDALDNRRENLRLCTLHQNCMNKTKAWGAVEYKGVFLSRGLYRAHITVSGRRVYLGGFEEPEKAARAYDVAALKCFGDFAATNFERSSYSGQEIESFSLETGSPNKRVALVRGVSKCRGKWQARISVGGKLVHLGSFTSPEEAGNAYRMAAFDRRNAPRRTAESRELAKPHSWHADESDP
jgi:hypothetical protein